MAYPMTQEPDPAADRQAQFAELTGLEHMLREAAYLPRMPQRRRVADQAPRATPRAILGRRLTPC